MVLPRGNGLKEIPNPLISVLRIKQISFGIAVCWHIQVPVGLLPPKKHPRFVMVPGFVHIAAIVKPAIYHYIFNIIAVVYVIQRIVVCLLYTSPSPRD